MTPDLHSAAIKEADMKKMWTEYMKEAEKYDNRAAEGWTKDADGLLVFVRFNYFPAVRCNDRLEDWSFFCNSWRIHHRILQEVVSR